MPPRPQKLLIGTYTEKLPHVDGHAAGILAADFSDGRLAELSVAAEARNPSWLTTSRDGRFVYAALEVTDFEGESGGVVAAYARDADGRLTLLGTRPSGGADPAHLALDPTERFVVVANYGNGSVTAFPRETDGALGAATDHVQHDGAQGSNGVNSQRQSGPHAHQVLFDPVSGDFLVPDLGLDAVLVYRLGDDGSLTPKPELRIPGEGGAGPRHLAFHPGGQHLFVLNELNSTVVVLRREGAGFVRTDVASTLPAGFDGTNYPSAIRTSASGDSVLVANRGHDSIAVFAFDASAGAVELRLAQSTLGRTPRDFVQSPDGSQLVVGNQDSDTIVVFDFDERTPALTPVSTLGVPTPVCLRFG